MVNGWGQAEQALEQGVKVGGWRKVGPAHHVRDALIRVIDHDGQMIARRHVFADNHRIAPGRGIGDAVRLGPVGVPIRDADRLFGGGAYPVHRDAKRARAIGKGAVYPGVGAIRTTDRTVAGGAVRIARGAGIERRLELGARRGAPVRDAKRRELRCCRAIGIEALRLKEDGFLPCEAQPCEVLKNGVNEFGARAADVDVLDAKEEPATRS